jgi:thioredoxin reductase (NADPH)
MSSLPELNASLSGQMELLKSNGAERVVEEGEYLFRIGDAGYPFVAIVEGEASVRDETGSEIIRYGPGGFLGEQGFLSGQAVFVDVVAVDRMCLVEVPREKFLELLFDHPHLSDVVLSMFVRRRESLQRKSGVGIGIVGERSDPETRRLIDFARQLGLPHERIDPDPESDDGAELPLVRLPGGDSLANPGNGELSRALGIGLELKPREEVDLLVLGGGPAGLGAAVYGASEGLDTLVLDGSALGGQAGESRRIENYLGFPGGISGSELTSRAVAQARKFHARMATPYQAQALRPGQERHVVELEDGHEVSARAGVIATGAQYRRLPVEDLGSYEGISVFYAAGPPEADLCGGSRLGVVGGGNSAAQAAIWLARGGALVTLLHRRADLSETMSDYLIRDLDRYGVRVRGRSEIETLHGSDGDLEAVGLKDGERLTLSYLFLFLGAEPCTDWLAGEVETDRRGFIVTGEAAGVDGLLETSVPGIFAAGDVRSGSIKRCATAAGEGATAIQLVHQRLAPGEATRSAA